MVRPSDASDILREGTASDQLRRYPVVGWRGMVVSSQPLATQAGLRVLEQGGNAFDAALAVSAVLCVVEPYASHLGGDAFLQIYRSGWTRPVALNASGPAPGSLPGLPAEGGIPQRGVGAVTVPGLVAAWGEVHARYGIMPLASVLSQAIEYASEGFPVGYRLSLAISTWAEALRAFPSWSDLFLRDNVPLPPGHLLRQPRLAATLQRIATAGPQDFYTGDLARRLVEFVASQGGYLSMEDLASYSPEWVEPLCTTYRGYSVYAQPPVSQGHILLEELNLVEGFPLSKWGFGSPEAVHVMVEAKRIAFADRDRWSGDPRRVKMPVGELISKETAERRRSIIRLDSVASITPQVLSLPGRDTTAFAVADAQGNLVAFIQSIFHPFGAGVVVDQLGILLNNRLFGFSAVPTSPNRLEPGKRPVHTLNTYMVFRNGRPFAFGGSPGGEYQVQTNFQVLVNLIDFGMDAQASVDAPRWGHDAAGLLHVESRFPPETLERLQRIGHRVDPIPGWANPSRAFLIVVDGNVYWGAADSRSDGVALGR
jgi:gamma-glutamyltranspeptidase/glutathione hydrolase